MRGALTKVAGVSGTTVVPGNAKVAVTYDPRQTNVEALLAALAAAGEKATAE